MEATTRSMAYQGECHKIARKIELRLSNNNTFLLIGLTNSAKIMKIHAKTCPKQVINSWPMCKTWNTCIDYVSSKYLSWVKMGIAIHRKERSFRGRKVPSAEGRFLYGRKLLNKFIS